MEPKVLENAFLKATNIQLEVAKILGEPRDPRKPVSSLVSDICNLDTAMPDEYVYYYDALVETDKVYTLSSTGALTEEAVSPDVPVAFTFVNMSSPQYYVSIPDLANAKENVLGRKVATINRAMNAWEDYYIMTTAQASVQAGNMFDLTSGSTTFNYKNLTDMLDAVKDYGDNYVLAAGTLIDRDIVQWDWTDNKYQSIKAALGDLNVSIRRVNKSVTVDGSSTSVLASTKAFLFATDTEMGKPMLFVRKRLDTIANLGGLITEKGEMPERLIFTTPNPTNVGATKYLAYGITGYEQVVMACVNSYALSSFSRT
jgi:hypothetical protein